MAAFKDVISSAMPFIGSLLGGPIGGKAGEFLAQALTGDKFANQDDIAKAFLSASANVDKLLELKKIDEQYKEKVLSTYVENLNLENEDRDSARRVQVENVKAHSLNMPAILSLIIIPGFFLVLLLIMMYPVQEPSRNVIDLLIGFLGGSLGQVIAFYFGTTHGSLEKTRLMFKSVSPQLKNKKN
jgi:hypothetical protein